MPGLLSFWGLPASRHDLAGRLLGVDLSHHRGADGNAAPSIGERGGAHGKVSPMRPRRSPDRSIAVWRSGASDYTLEELAAPQSRFGFDASSDLGQPFLPWI
jgi:hypothetical protein